MRNLVKILRKALSTLFSGQPQDQTYPGPKKVASSLLVVGG